MSYDRLRTRGVVLLIVWLAVLAVSARVAVGQPREPTLLYSRTPDFKGWQTQIHTHGLSSGVTTPISEPLWGSWAFDWSLDGRRIAYGGTLGLTVVDWRGNDPQTFAKGVASGIWMCDWSPDGRDVLFSGSVGGRSEIFAVHLATGRADRLAGLPGGSNGEPEWSPNGRQIAFIGELDVYTMDADGRNTVRLTETWERESSATWAPHGDEIAYLFEYREIRAMRPDGKKERLIVRADGALDNIWSVSWTADPSLLVYTEVRPNGGRIVSIRHDGSDRRVLMEEDGVHYSSARLLLPGLAVDAGGKLATTLGRLKSE
jgi:dipeptidyl aminopeptidase/acylaminoacyl peptidase